MRHAHVKPDAHVPSMQKAWKGRSGAKWVRKVGGGEEDKGGDLLPKLLLTPLLPALRLLVPNLLWALLTNYPRVVGEKQRGEGGSHDRIINQVGDHTVSNESENEQRVEYGDATYKPSGPNVYGSRR